MSTNHESEPGGESWFGGKIPDEDQYRATLEELGERADRRRRDQHFPEKMRGYRENMGVSQQELADMLGVDITTILSLERPQLTTRQQRVWQLRFGYTDGRRYNQAEVAKILGVYPDERWEEKSSGLEKY